MCSMGVCLRSRQRQPRKPNGSQGKQARLQCLDIHEQLHGSLQITHAGRHVAFKRGAGGV